jgi:hypothetical protein
MSRPVTIHWGVGAVIAFVLFAGIILTMVFISMSQRVDLVAEDYYQQELGHQARIESEQRLSAIGERPVVSVAHSTVTLKFPRALPPAELTGSLLFYRPDDRTRDFVVPLRLDSSGTQHVPVASAKPGLWRLKARWIFRSDEFYFEEALFIP